MVTRTHVFNILGNYSAARVITYMTVTQSFLIPEFPFVCPAREQAIKPPKLKVSVVFPTFHTLPSGDKSFPFPCPAVPVDV